MHKRQAAGYIFEKIILKMLKKNGYISVNTSKLRGRGADHQIDAYGTFSFPIPFVNPIRLICEAKCWSDPAGLADMRSFFGVVRDISEKYDSSTRKFIPRWSDSGCFFSLNGFTSKAEGYAWAHNIYLVSFLAIPGMRGIANGIFLYLDKLKGLSRMSKKRLINSAKVIIEDLGGGSMTVGLFDSTYPVILYASNNFDINEYLEGVGRIQSSVDAHKSNRENLPDGALFTVNFDGRHCYFQLPKRIADKLSSNHNTNRPGAIIGKIDVPVVKDTADEFLKKIVRINIRKS